MVRSDNGGNFVKANKELEELISQLRLETLRQKFPTISWKFTPPKSPHMGGFYERMMALVKHSIKATMPADRVDEEEFRTMVCGIEAAINNRPLTQSPNADPADPESLTPAHFLIGDRFTDIAALPAGQKYPHQRRWFALQSILDQFWRRFVAEILPQFHLMNGWVREVPGLQVGDVVLVLEKDDRGNWPLGRILEVYPTERDGRTRKVKVKMATGTFVRSSHGLLLLDAMLGKKRQQNVKTHSN